MRVMAIGAHPDDIEIGCGGSLFKYAQEGASLLFIVATSGQMGSISTSPEELSEVRRKEALASANHFGADLEFLDLVDGLSRYEDKDKYKLIRLIREFAPDLCYIHSRQDNFLDHKVVHELAMSSLLGAQGPWYQVAGGKPHKVNSILGYEVWHPLNTWQRVVDISKTLDKKLASLMEHSSQTSTIDYVRATKGLANYRGAMAGLQAAEVFEVLRCD